MWAIPFVGAGNGIRTRDIQLGRLTLYQLSYSRGFRLLWLGGGRRIRTFEGVSRQIYSLLPLAARASLLEVVRWPIPFPSGWSWRRESNPRPPAYKAGALPAELRQPSVKPSKSLHLDKPTRTPM